MGTERDASLEQMDPSTERPSPWSRVRAICFDPRALLALLIVGTLVDRSRALSTPISGVRPTQSAMIAGNLDRDLDEFGLRAILYPRVDYAGDGEGYLLLEFPLVNLAGVFFQRVFELPQETAYRLPSLLFFAAFQALLFAFVRTRFGALEAVAAVLLASSFPVVVSQSVEVMPEQIAATAFLAGLYCTDRHLDRGRTLPLVAATVCFALMLLVKSTTGLLLLVPLGLFHVRRGSLRELFRVRYALAAAACVAPLAWWTSHAAQVNRASVLDDGTRVSDYVMEYAAQRGRWPLLASFETYADIALMMSLAYGSAALALGAVGIAIGVGRRGSNWALIAAWLAALLLYFVALPFHTSTHPYYTHGYAASIALGGALVVAPLVRRAALLVPGRGRRIACALLAAAALAFVLQARSGYTPHYDRAQHKLANALKRFVPPRALGIVSTEDMGEWDGVLFFASDTRGWRRNFLDPGDARAIRSLESAEASEGREKERRLQAVSEELSRRQASRFELTLEFIEEKRLQGATFLAHYGSPDELAALLPDTFRTLTERYTLLARTPNWIVFSLER